MKALLSLAPAAVIAAAFVGCGSGPDAASSSEIAGVLIVPASGCCSGNGYISALALGSPASGSAALFATATTSNGGGSSFAYAVGLAPPTVTPFNYNGGSSNGSELSLALSPDGMVWWAQPAQGMAQWQGPGILVWAAAGQTATPGMPSTPAPTWASFPLVTPPTMNGSPYNSSTLVGSVADSDALYVAVAAQPNKPGMPGMGNPTAGSPNSPGWPTQNGATSQHSVTPGLIFAVARPAAGNPGPGALNAAPPSIRTSFDATSTIDDLVASPTELYWLAAESDSSMDLDEVQRAPTGWANGTAPTPTTLDRRTDLPPGWSLVAIANRGSTVAWAAAPDVALNATGCRVWTSDSDGPPKQVYDGTQAAFFCRGLAIDDAYAYVTMNRAEPNQTGGGGSMGTNGPILVVGDGIARIPLAGGAAQSLSLQSQNWYGPRRVLVDDTYVYAVDPSYVLRVPKTAFGP